MNITIKDFMWLASDESCEQIEVWDMTSGETIFKGYYDDLEEGICSYEIMSWNGTAEGICFNIQLEE